LDQIDAEFALAEGGDGLIKDGRSNILEWRQPRNIAGGYSSCRGSAGHGSIPRPDNAIVRLSKAISKLAAYVPPMRLNETTRTYFERLAKISPPEAAARYRISSTRRNRPKSSAISPSTNFATIP